jgi:hypothetical protein
VAAGKVGVKGLGEALSLEGKDHLDDAQDAGGGLGVADVALEAAQPKWVVQRAVAAIGFQKGVCLDGVAQGGAGAVSLNGIDVEGGEAGVAKGGGNDLLLSGAVWSSKALAAAILVDSAAADKGQDWVAEAESIVEAFQEQKATAFGPAGAVSEV